MFGRTFALLRLYFGTERVYKHFVPTARTRSALAQYDCPAGCRRTARQHTCVPTSSSALPGPARPIVRTESPAPAFGNLSL